MTQKDSQCAYACLLRVNKVLRLWAAHNGPQDGVKSHLGKHESSGSDWTPFLAHDLVERVIERLIATPDRRNVRKLLKGALNGNFTHASAEFETGGRDAVIIEVDKECLESEIRAG